MRWWKLAIDDMRAWRESCGRFEPPRRSMGGPVSIMTCVDPKHPHLQQWLKEGWSLKSTFIDHPARCCKGDPPRPNRLTTAASIS